MQSRQRLLQWEACLNARDIGGYPTATGSTTRWGAVFRSDNLSRLTSGGRQALLSAGVRTIVDVRSRYELDIDPPWFHSASSQSDPYYVNVSLFTEAAAAATQSVEDFTQTYRIIADVARAEMAAIVTTIARAPEGGVLVHCHSGKDRTGMVIAILLDLVGVPRELIAADYAFSAEALHAIREEELSAASGEELRQLIHEVYSCPPERIVDTLEHIDTTYGGVEMYLLGSGVSPMDLERLRKRLREQ